MRLKHTCLKEQGQKAVEANDFTHFVQNPISAVPGTPDTFPHTLFLLSLPSFFSFTILLIFKFILLTELGSLNKLQFYRDKFF